MLKQEKNKDLKIINNMLYKVKKNKNFVLGDKQPAGIYIRQRFSNVFVTLTDFNHKVIVCKTSCSCCIKCNKKRKTTPQTIEAIALSLTTYFKRYNINEIRLFLKSRINPLVFYLIRYLMFFNIKVLEISINTIPQTHTYCRKRIARRR